MKNDPIITIDLHGMRQEEAIRTIDRALAEAGSAVYQLQLVHGYNHGTSLRSMIQDFYRYDNKVKRIMLGGAAIAAGNFEWRRRIAAERM